MAWELWTFRFPVVLPDAPLGTYARPTVLGLLMGAFSFGLMAAGAALAFRRPALGGLVLVLSGFYGLLDEMRWRLQDPTLPPDSFTFGVVAVALPVLAAGALVLASWRSERRPSSTAPARSSLWGKLAHHGPRPHPRPTG
jgi:hypothetical protein